MSGGVGCLLADVASLFGVSNMNNIVMGMLFGMALTYFGYWLRGVADRWKRENAELE